MRTFRTTWILTFLVLEHIQASYCQGPQLYQEYLQGDTIEVQENKKLNLTFWVDASSCKDPTALFRLEVQTSRTDSTYDNDGRVVRWKNKCKVTFKKFVQCISDDGPAELYKTVNQSHKEVIWTMSWKDEESKKLITWQTRLKLNVIHNPEQDKWSKALALQVLIGICILAVIVTVFIVMRRRKWCSKQGIAPEDKGKIDVTASTETQARKQWMIMLDLQMTVKHGFRRILLVKEKLLLWCIKPKAARKRDGVEELQDCGVPPLSVPAIRRQFLFKERELSRDMSHFFGPSRIEVEVNLMETSVAL